MEKIMNFLNKYKAIVLCAIGTIFSLLIPVVSFFRFFVYAIVFIGALFLIPQDSVSIYAYLFFFTVLTGTDLGAFVMWGLLLIALALRYFYFRHLGKAPKLTTTWLLCILFYVCTMIPFWNYKAIYGLGFAWMMLLPIMIIYIYRNELKANRILNYMIGGLFVSSIIALIFNKCGIYTEYIMMAGRMRGFMDNPNYYYFACLVVIAGLVVDIFNRYRNWWDGLLLISISIFLGSRTYSKGFLLGLAIIICFTVLLALIKNKKVGLIVLGSIVVALVVLYFCFRGYFDYMINRFLYSGEVTLNSITTDRWLVWKEFFGEWTSSAKNIIFGVGGWSGYVLAVTPDHICGPHSIYIEFLYNFGLLGLVLLGVIAFSLMKTSQEEKGKYVPLIKTESVLPLLIVMVIGLIETVFYSQKGFLLPFALLYIYNNTRYITDEKRKKIKKVKGENK